MNSQFRLITIIFALIFLSFSTSFAGTDEGVAAYDRGDFKDALREFRMSAAQGDPRAQYNLGVMYRSGKGVALDYEEADRWYRNAAELGHVGAQFSLGLMYQEGYVGKMFVKGQGMRNNYVKALMWFNISASNGHKRSKESMSDIKRQMTPENVSKAQTLAKKWLRTWPVTPSSTTQHKSSPNPVEKTISTKIRGVLQEALDLARNEKDPDLRVDRILDVAEAQIKIGITREARMNLSEALFFAHRIEKPFNRSGALCAISKSLGKVGDIGRARKTIAEALLAARSVDRTKNVNITNLVCVAKSQVAIGNIKEGKSTLRNAALEASGNTDVSFYMERIAKAQVDAGDINAAFTTARNTEREANIADALTYIAEAQAKGGNAKIARKTLNEALTVIRREKEASYRYPPLVKIAELQTEIGDAEEARKTFEEAFATSRLVEELQFRYGGMESVARAQIKAGDIDAALKTVEDIKWAGNFANVGIALANFQIKNGDIEQARENLSLALENARTVEEGAFAFRSHIMIKIAKAYRMAGDDGDAKRIHLEVVSDVLGEKKDWMYMSPLPSVAEEQARAGDISAALKTARNDREDRDRVRALTKVAVVMAELEEND
jgi:tetratricopeptide (TPR) repeat protein